MQKLEICSLDITEMKKAGNISDAKDLKAIKSYIKNKEK